MKVLKYMRISGFAAVLFVILVEFAFITPADAQPRNISLIRDAEIESTIRSFAAPIFRAAGLDQNAIRVHIVADPTLNAFVLGGQRIFINTGLLQRAEHPGQLIGVIAHEAGHVAGGHLSRLRSELGNATLKTILSTVLGVAVGIVSESPAAGIAIQQGGLSLSQRGVLSFTRSMEASADQAALRYLDDAGISSLGMKEFLVILGNQSGRRIGIDPYLQTHPEPEARAAAVDVHLSFSRYTNQPIPLSMRIRHERMRGKLDGYLLPYDIVNRQHPANDNSITARYARAIALFRRGDLAPSLNLIEGLKLDFPNDAFIFELEGDALFNNQQILRAIVAYEKSVQLAPNEPLLRLSLARAQLETENTGQARAARDNLLAALAREPGLTSAWKQLNIAYGRLGDQANSALAHAEYGFRIGDTSLAEFQARKALTLLPEGSPGSLRAQDLLSRLTR